VKPCWEIDENGEIIEHYLFSDKELEEAKAQGKVIIDFPWSDPYYRPKFDQVSKNWVEGLSQAEIEAIQNQVAPKSELEQLKEDNAELNLQLIDLWETLINGGVI
jgi:hypothetical protein